MPANVWLLNLIVLGVTLEADLGCRAISRFRVLRPVLTAILLVPMVLTSVPADSRDLALEAAGVVAGVALGLACHLLVRVGYDPLRRRRSWPGRSAATGRAVSRCGAGYAAFWVVIYAARLLFIYGTIHWFPAAVGQFMASHRLSGDGLTDALIFMALAMALARTSLLAARGRAAGRRASVIEPAPAAAVAS